MASDADAAELLASIAGMALGSPLHHELHRRVKVWHEQHLLETQVEDKDVLPEVLALPPPEEPVHPEEKQQGFFHRKAAEVKKHVSHHKKGK